MNILSGLTLHQLREMGPNGNHLGGSHLTAKVLIDILTLLTLTQ